MENVTEVEDKSPSGSGDHEVMMSTPWEGIMFTIQTNPLLIDTILRSLFAIVDYETLKECRLVCSKWKMCSDPEFIYQSAFCLRTTLAQSPMDIPIPTLFKSINEQEFGEIYFPAFKFSHAIFTPNIREIYIKPYLLTMVQLEISSYRSITDNNGSIDSNADELIGPNLRKLMLAAGWKVSLEKLVSIPHICLHQCIIISNSTGLKIAPQKLTLNHCKSERQMDSLANVVTIREWSEIIDFRLLRELTLSYSFSDSNRIQIEPRDKHILNLADCSNVKRLTLIQVPVNLNGMISPEFLSLIDNSYRRDEVEISDIVLSDFITTTAYVRRMSIESLIYLPVDDYNYDFEVAKTFHFENFVSTVDDLQIGSTVSYGAFNSGNNIKKLDLFPRYGSQVDLSALPKTVQVLLIPNFAVTCSQPATFPNLRKLSLAGSKEIDITPFQSCPSLTSIKLALSHLYEDKVLNLDQLPSSIKCLSLENIIGAKLVGTTKCLKLEVLVLPEWRRISDERVGKMIAFFKLQMAHKFEADVVLIHIKGRIYSKDKEFSTEKEIAEVIANLRGTTILIGKFVFGPVLWKKGECIQNANLVDKKAEFYLFEDGKGKGISRDELLKRIPCEFYEITDY